MTRRVLGVGYQAAPLAMMWNTNPSTVIPTATAAIGSSTSAVAFAPFTGPASRMRRALHVDLARHLDRGVVAVVTPPQGPAERVGLLLGARRPEPLRCTVP